MKLFGYELYKRKAVLWTLQFMSDIRSNRVVLLAFRDTCSGNTNAVYRYIKKNCPDFEVKWAFYHAEKAPTDVVAKGDYINLDSLEGLHYFATSRYILTDTSFNNDLFKSRKQICIQMWHGDRGFKKVQYAAYPDGKYYDNSIKPIKIDKESFLNNNIAIWLASDFNLEYPHENISGGYDYQIKDPILNSKIVVNCVSCFDTNALPYNPNVIYHNIFNTEKAPIVIIEHIGRGYEIISTTEIIKDIPKYIQLMYEAIFYCFLNSYKKTESLSQWICSNVPDFQIESGKLVKKQYFMSNIDLFNYFGLKASEFDIYSVNIYKSNGPIDPSQDLFEPNSTVHFIGMSGGKLMFTQDVKEDSPYFNEPEKPMGWISIYDGSKIIYLSELHYKIETNLEDKVFTVTNEYDLDVKILAFKSTSLGIDTQMPIDKVIPFVKTEVNKIERIREAEYLFYINLSNQNIDFTFKEDYKEDLGIALFTIKVYQTPDAVNIIDMRQLGGGLVEDAIDNFNLMDIGHINGRPYRPTGTIVFTLPTKYKVYEDNILKAINRYISSTDIPVIIFEDEKQ